MYLWIIFGIVLLYLFYKNYYKPSKYWEERNIPHLYSVPIFGSNASNLITRKLAFPDLIIAMYNKHPTAKYVGLHQFTDRVLMIRDPETIKRVTVKDFDSFMNHRVVFTEDNEPLFGKNLLSLKDQKWKDMRATLSPAFTSSKMRLIFQLITECSQQFVNYFTKELEKGPVEIEMKDIFTRYTNDVIATSAFGITCNSLEQKENEFYMIGKKSTNLTTTGFIKIMLFAIFPNFMKSLGITVMDKKVTGFFSDIIMSTLKLREKENIVRPDMIHLLMEAKKGRLRHETTEQDNSFSAVDESSIGKNQNEKPALTDEDIIAQAFIFFFAGYDTASTLMSFMAHEIAVNPDIQKRLQEEIDEVVAHKKLDYESILKMKYLDNVVSETLRKWPPAGLTERLCEKTYTIQTEDEPDLTIESNTSIWVPVHAIHHDPKYFPEPEKFDPDRFNDENKNNIQPFTYLPFGAGPRNCIGSRFALLEIKTLFVHLLSKFELTVIEKTQIPLKFNRKAFNISTEKGIWLGLELRK